MLIHLAHGWYNLLFKFTKARISKRNNSVIDEMSHIKYTLDGGECLEGDNYCDKWTSDNLTKQQREV